MVLTAITLLAILCLFESMLLSKEEVLEIENGIKQQETGCDPAVLSKPYT